MSIAEILEKFEENGWIIITDPRDPYSSNVWKGRKRWKRLTMIKRKRCGENPVVHRIEVTDYRERPAYGQWMISSFDDADDENIAISADIMKLILLLINQMEQKQRLDKQLQDTPWRATCEPDNILDAITYATAFLRQVECTPRECCTQKNQKPPVVLGKVRSVTITEDNCSIDVDLTKEGKCVIHNIIGKEVSCDV